MDVVLLARLCIKDDTMLWCESKKRGGYIFEIYSGDHRPYHVHIYHGTEFIGRFDIENQIPMDRELSSQLLKYLEELGYKKSSKG